MPHATGLMEIPTQAMFNVQIHYHAVSRASRVYQTGYASVQNLVFFIVAPAQTRAGQLQNALGHAIPVSKTT